MSGQVGRQFLPLVPIAPFVWADILGNEPMGLGGRISNPFEDLPHTYQGSDEHESIPYNTCHPLTPRTQKM